MRKPDSDLPALTGAALAAWLGLDVAFGGVHATVYNLDVLLAARASALLLVCLFAAPACRGNDPLQVTTIQLGRSLNPDKTVATHTTRFKPGDTIYASVLTDGSGSGTIGAKWWYAGRLVSEPTQRVSYKGAAATEFHIQTSSRLPPGDYKVEILLDGQSIGTREFRVEK